ncbi:adenylate cyclase class 2 [Stackebrandtia endophytica]|uniref:Adenylate cyclase class 2 n=1 Tax=Stackebrandtia endophytica TaxID=1496996 RepID=A0A543B119_9ACTN|nr:CYTH domain-containing protein [Stackebrandtia endophytica]TQL78509.1 adenylate cyclase class 2 [Stackebrandtia endophytica]
MAVEYEAKILDIDPVETARMIVAAGGTHVEDRVMRRYVYDIDAGDATKWIRLRDNGTTTTLAVKQIAHDGIDGTSETEVTVDDFATANELLGLIGYTAKSYQENRRSSYRIGRVSLEIDTWPRIPSYLEIEADDVAAVRATARRLGFGDDRLTGENTTKIYARYGIDLAAIPELRFEPTPPGESS